MLWVCLALVLCVGVGEARVESLFELSAKDITGDTISLSKFQNKVLLIANVASRCGVRTCLLVCLFVCVCFVCQSCQSSCLFIPLCFSLPLSSCPACPPVH